MSSSPVRGPAVLSRWSNVASGQILVNGVVLLAQHHLCCLPKSSPAGLVLEHQRRARASSWGPGGGNQADSPGKQASGMLMRIQCCGALLRLPTFILRRRWWGGCFVKRLKRMECCARPGCVQMRDEAAWRNFERLKVLGFCVTLLDCSGRCLIGRQKGSLDGNGHAEVERRDPWPRLWSFAASAPFSMSGSEIAERCKENGERPVTAGMAASELSWCNPPPEGHCSRRLARRIALEKGTVP